MKTKKIETKTKQECCRFCHPSISDMPNWHCVVDGWEDDKVKVVTAERCEKCERFDSKFIEYPLTIQGIESKEIDTSGLGHDCGALCEISPCGKEYEGEIIYRNLFGGFADFNNNLIQQKNRNIRKQNHEQSCYFCAGVKENYLWV